MWLAARYDAARTAQVVRVYFARAHRRRGIARTLVELARQFAATDGGYVVIYLHTDRRAPGAEAFWRTMPITLVYDPQGAGAFGETILFELAFPETGKGWPGCVGLPRPALPPAVLPV